MHFSTAILQAILLVSLSRSVAAQEPKTIRKGDCVVDPQLLSLPACALEVRNHETFVAQVYLPLFFGANADALGSVKKGTNGFAYFADAGNGWVYFNRTGRIVVRNVATMDNGPGAFHYGLVRIVRDRKWGLADTRGKIEIPLTYDGMLDYQEGKGWLACSDCHQETDPEEEHHWFKGGHWVWLDRHGNVARPAQPPSTPQTITRNP